MNKVLQKIKSSSFIQLTSWTLLSQLIVFLLSPISTRLFTPSQFGLYTLATSVVSMVVPVISLKFDSLIVTEKEEHSAYLAMLVSYISIPIISIVTIIIYYIYGVYSYIDISIFEIIIIFLILIVTGISNIGVSYANRLSLFNEIGKYNFIRSLFQNVILIIVGFIGFGVKGMLVSMLLGNFFGFSRIMKNKPKIKGKTIIVEDIKDYFKKNIDLLKYSFPAHFVNSFSYTILNFLIVALYDTEVFGYYSLAFRVLGLPLMVITQNMSRIFFKESSEEWNNLKSYAHSLKKSVMILVSVSIPMLIVLVLFSPTIFSVIFGKSWEMTGVFVQILAPMFAIRLIVSSLMTIFIVIQKQRVELLFQNMFLISSITVFIVSKILNLSIIYFLTGISISYSIIYIIIFIYIFRRRNQYD